MNTAALLFFIMLAITIVLIVIITHTIIKKLNKTSISVFPFITQTIVFFYMQSYGYRHLRDIIEAIFPLSSLVKHLSQMSYDVNRTFSFVLYLLPTRITIIEKPLGYQLIWLGYMMLSIGIVWGIGYTYSLKTNYTIILISTILIITLMIFSLFTQVFF